jgi:hypothetical protein
VRAFWLNLEFRLSAVASQFAVGTGLTGSASGLYSTVGRMQDSSGRSSILSFAWKHLGYIALLEGCRTLPVDLIKARKEPLSGLPTARPEVKLSTSHIRDQSITAEPSCSDQLHASRKVAVSRPNEVNECFQFTLTLPAILGPGVYSASNRNEYQKHNNNVSVE